MRFAKPPGPNSRQSNGRAASCRASRTDISKAASSPQGRSAAHRYREKERDIVGTTIYPAGAERPIRTLAAARRLLPLDGAVFCQSLEASRLDEVFVDAR